jgi:hypothetical protein
VSHPDDPQAKDTANDIDNPPLIGAEGTEPVGAPTRTGVAQPKDMDEMLDAALACTFPASDPIGCLTPDCRDSE